MPPGLFPEFSWAGIQIRFSESEMETPAERTVVLWRWCIRLKRIPPPVFCPSPEWKYSLSSSSSVGIPSSHPAGKSTCGNDRNLFFLSMGAVDQIFDYFCRRSGEDIRCSSIVFLSGCHCLAAFPGTILVFRRAVPSGVSKSAGSPRRLLITIWGWRRRTLSFSSFPRQNAGISAELVFGSCPSPSPSYHRPRYDDNLNTDAPPWVAECAPIMPDSP